MSALLTPTTDLAELDLSNKLHCFELDRRSFLKLFGGGLIVCLTGEHAFAQESGRGFGNHTLPTELSAWIHVAGAAESRQ